MSSIEKFRPGRVIRKDQLFFVLTDKEEELKLDLKHWRFPRIQGYAVLFDGKADRLPRDKERVYYCTNTYGGKPVLALVVPLLNYKRILMEMAEPRYQVQRGLFARGRGLVFRVIAEGTLSQIRERFPLGTLIPTGGEEYRFYIQDPPLKCGPWRILDSDPR